MGRREIYVGILLAIGAGGVAALIEGYSSSSPYLLSGGILAVAAVVPFLYRIMKNEPPIQPAPVYLVGGKDAPFTAEKVYVGDNNTPAVLLAKVENRTSIQIDEISDTYKGKWIKVEGTIYDAIRLNESGALVLYAANDARVRANFDISWMEKLAALNKGDIVEIEGQIEYIHGALKLTNCTILEISGPKDITPTTRVSPTPRRARAKKVTPEK